MAALDAIYNGSFTLIPKREAYLDMFKDYDHADSFFHENVVELKNKIILLLDSAKINTDTIRLNPKLKHLFCPDDSIFNKKIIESINDRMGNVPAKYDKVIDLIKSNSSISKKTLINTLWSFHCNSNFQRMRWRLLLKDSIIDDTKNKDTIYKI